MPTTATLPGGGSKNNVTITFKDTIAAGALQAAIDAQFKAAGKNITANTVASGVAGKASYFNYLYDTVASGKASALTAGAGVQAIIDTGKLADTLTGSTSTTLFVANNKGDVINTRSTGIASVFGGTGNDTVNVSGVAVTYLEGGDNVVDLAGGDNVTLAGVGGADTVNVFGGANRITADYAASVGIYSARSSDTLALAGKSSVLVSGARDSISLTTGAGTTVTVTGGGDTINAGNSAVAVTIAGTSGNDTLTLGKGSTITIAGAKDTISLAGTGSTSVKETGASATLIGGTGAVSVTGGTGTLSFTAGAGAATITAGSGAASVAGGAGKVTFAHGFGGHDTYTAGTGAGTLTGAGMDTKGSDLFNFNIKTASTTLITSFSAGKDTIAIAGATSAEINKALKSAHVTVKGGVTTTEFTVGNDKFTVIGGALTNKNVIT